MYVELSPRQSGKTTRLINALVEFLRENPDNTALLVAPTNNQRSQILRIIGETYGHDYLYRIITSHKMIPSRRGTMKNFVDEYGLIDEKYIFLDENGYYSTTVCNTPIAKEIHRFYVEEYIMNFSPNKIIKRLNF